MIDTIPGWTPNQDGVPTAPPSGPQEPDRTSGNAPERDVLCPEEQK